jgi:hypothetical protein
MLTLAQTLLIEIKTLTPPWRASQLPDPSRTVSLRSVVDAAGEQRIPIFERVRPLSVLLSRRTWAELTSLWSDAFPSAGQRMGCLI